MSAPAEDTADPSSESLFASWLERVESGEEADMEALCRAHPEHAAGLRALHGKWLRFQGALEQSSLHGSLASELLRQFGSGADPGVTLEQEGPTPADFSSDVLTRLTGKDPATTRYSLKGEVAHGGMGAVLRVWDRDLRRHLAMKVMLGRGVAGASGDTPSVDPRLLARFLEEAQITGQLDHPGIVPVHELGLDAEGRVYFTMKLVQGRTLREVFGEQARGEGGWTAARVLGLLQRVCEAMSYAHAKGVIHRDLKPANVMVGRFGEVYVMDWGLAKVLGRQDERDIRLRAAGGEGEATLASEHEQDPEVSPGSPLLTMEGDVVGTPAYMPPEQARGELDAMGPHSDVYAVGAMLYHLLAGHMPYVHPGERPSSRAIWLRVQQGPPKPLQEAAPQAPPELVALCEQAMAREVGRRYPDMSALSAELAAYLEGRVVAAYESGAWAEARKWVRRNKALALSLAAGVLTVVAGSVALGIKEGQARRSAQFVFHLEALQYLELLLSEADALWPPHPDQIERYRSWLEEAEALVAELPSHRAEREEYRALASPRSEEERQRERERHPDLPRLAALQGELAGKRAALLQRRDGVSAELPEVDWSAQPESWEELRPRTIALVRRKRDEFGREAEGLVLARRVLELAGDEPDRRARSQVTLAFANFSLGRDDEALAAAAAVLEVAPEESRDWSEERVALLRAAVEEARSKEGLRAAEAEVLRLERELVALEARVSERRDWRFPEEHGEARRWNTHLTGLIDGLEALVAEETGLLSPAGVSPEHSWSVPRRLAFALEMKAEFAERGRYADAWRAALPAIHEDYPGLDLPPQLGLLPIGADPESGLWEFAHLMSGVPARRQQGDGKLELTEETGVVLVLLPGGTFLMGAQDDDPSGLNYHVEPEDSEEPVHEVELSPFFLSKYEMTRGQWSRLTGSDPSVKLGTSEHPLLQPVRNISWLECFEWLPRWGLVLPSEARWEYGARAGTDTPWFTGPELRSLWVRRAANLGVNAAANSGVEPELDDGFRGSAPVGCFLANAFGLHDVVGNVAERCLDGYDPGFYARSPRSDPVAPWAGAQTVVIRGGSWKHPAYFSRSSSRSDNDPQGRTSYYGVRPARELER